MSKIPSSKWSTILKIVVTIATALLGVITGSSFSS
ncbi:MAG: smalltalk protein [Bacteroidaceae bacterium]|nr:smalltalk protein [Bacteroidaceae bacterium]